MTETPMPRSNVQERITPDFAEYTLKLYATMVPQTYILTVYRLM